MFIYKLVDAKIISQLYNCEYLTVCKLSTLYIITKKKSSIKSI